MKDVDANGKRITKFKCIKCKHENQFFQYKYPEPFRVRFFNQFTGKECTLWMRKHGLGFKLV